MSLGISALLLSKGAFPRVSAIGVLYPSVVDGHLFSLLNKKHMEFQMSFIEGAIWKLAMKLGSLLSVLRGLCVAVEPPFPVSFHFLSPGNGRIQRHWEFPMNFEMGLKRFHVDLAQFH